MMKWILEDRVVLFNFNKIHLVKVLKVLVKSIMNYSYSWNSLQTKPQIKNLNINYYDLYYTDIKRRNEMENVNNDEYEKDYSNFNDFITPNHYFGRKKW